ncbi:MAG: segregation and condensation protein B [Rhodospirillaceae bacterium]|nr:MAG: segregation and condensation protein B [Rhodospirillaceae bacterium]
MSPVSEHQARENSERDRHGKTGISDHHVYNLRVVRALLFAATEPLTEEALRVRLSGNVDVAALLAKLQHYYADSGVNLVQVEGRWQLRTTLDLAETLHVEAVIERKLSRS